MSDLQKQLAKYYKDIDRALLNPRSTKKTILTEIRSNVDCYMEENPSSSFDDIVAHFGSASDIAKSHIECTPSDEIQRRIRARNKIILITVIATLIALLIYIGAVLVEVSRFRNEVDGHEEVVVEEVN